LGDAVTIARDYVAHRLREGFGAEVAWLVRRRPPEQ